MLPFFRNLIILCSPILSLPSPVLNSNTLFCLRLSESTSKRYLCCSAAFTYLCHELEQSQPSSDIKSIKFSCYKLAVDIPVSCCSL